MTFVEVLRFIGLVLLIAALPALVFGWSAADCLVIAVVGFGLSRQGAP